MSITRFTGSETISCANVNSRIQQINGLFPIPVSDGGTGASTAEQARTNLGVETTKLLYQNVSGTASTITLPQQASSGTRWGIYYGINNIGGYQECDPTGGATLNIYEAYITANNNLWVRSALVYLDKTARTISMARNSTFVIYANGNHGTNDEQLKIYNVIGYI